MAVNANSTWAEAAVTWAEATFTWAPYSGSTIWEDATLTWAEAAFPWGDTPSSGNGTAIRPPWLHRALHPGQR